jgi:hypothetical protein
MYIIDIMHQTTYAAGHPLPHPPRYWAHGSWLTTNYDVLLPLLPQGLIYAMNTNPNHSFVNIKYTCPVDPFVGHCTWKVCAYSRSLYVTFMSI